MKADHLYNIVFGVERNTEKKELFPASKIMRNVHNELCSHFELTFQKWYATISSNLLIGEL